MALILKVGGSFSADGESMYMQDLTGVYNSSSNVGGWGAPNVLSTQVTTFQVVCNWVSAGSVITYDFTASSGTITAATCTDNEGTTVNILSYLASTAFPIVDPNFLDLTDTFDDGIVLPTLADGQYTLTYKVISGSVPFTYTTSTTYFRYSDLCCCLSNLRLEADAECDCSDEVITRVNRVEFWLNAAICAVETGKSNTVALNYFTKAQDLCESDCGSCN